MPHIATWKPRRRRCWAWWTTCSTPRKGWPPTRPGNGRSSSGSPATTGRRPDHDASCRRSADCWPAPKWVWCTSRAAGRWAGAARAAGNRRAPSCTPTSHGPENNTCNQRKRYHCADSRAAHDNVVITSTSYRIIVYICVRTASLCGRSFCYLYARLPAVCKSYNVTFYFNSLFFFFFFFYLNIIKSD